MGYINVVGLILFLAMGVLFMWMLFYFLNGWEYFSQVKTDLADTNTCITKYKALLGDVGAIIYCRLFANIEMIVMVLVMVGFAAAVWVTIRRMMLGYDEPF